MSAATLHHAAELIARHFPREQRGPIWERVHRVAAKRRINRGFLRTVERRQRIDQWRNLTRARNERHRVFLEPLNEQIIIVPTPAPSSIPGHFLETLFSVLTERECQLVRWVYLEDMKQKTAAQRFGVTEARVSQIMRAINRKLFWCVLREYPGLRAERR